MPTPISRHWTLEEALRTSHLVPNQVQQVLRYGRIHSVQQIRKDLERTARTLLDLFCDAFGNGVNSSFYRCQELNRLVGGASNSAHMVGLACDWEPPGPAVESERTAPIKDAIEWALRQEGLPFDRLIVEERGKARWLHIQAAEEGATPARVVYHSPLAGVFTKVTLDQVLALTV
jgi:zinc D-Ala-D-Ala carboxypeptidase